MIFILCETGRVMKLRMIIENKSSKILLYKGVSVWGGLRNWPEHRVDHIGRYIPGFTSTYHIALTYSEPKLTGSSRQAGMIAEFEIDMTVVEDRTKQFIKWCDDNGEKDYDVSLGFPKEWREDSSIWTVCDSGSAHDGVSCFNNSSFVYCGVPIKYRVVNYFHNQREWEQQTHEF